MEGYIIVSTTYNKTAPGISLEERLSSDFRSRVFMTIKEAQGELIDRIQIDAEECQKTLFPPEHFGKEEHLEKVGGILIGGTIIFRYATEEEACVIKYRIRGMELNININVKPGLHGPDDL